MPFLDTHNQFADMIYGLSPFGLGLN